MTEEPVPQSEQDGEAPAEQQVEGPADQGAETPVEPEVETAGDQNAEAPAEQALEVTAEEAAGAPAEPEAEAAAEQDADASEEQRTEGPADQDVDASVEQEAEAEAEDSTGGGAEATGGQDAEEEANPLAKMIADQKEQVQAGQEAEAPDKQEAEGEDDPLAKMIADQKAQVAAAQEAQVPARQSDAESTEKDGEDRPAGPVVSDDSPRRSVGWKVRGLLSRVSATHLFLLVNTLAVVVLTALVFRLPGRQPRASLGGQGVVSDEPTGPGQEGTHPPAGVDAVSQDTRNISWRLARSAFAKEDYAAALRQYGLLYNLARRDPAAELMSDFFGLRMAQCFKHLGDARQARKYFGLAASSKSPAVQAMAYYQLAVIDERDGKYLRARMRAYQAAAALAALPVSSAAETDCDFIIARTLTRKALSFYGPEQVVPWSESQQTDLFTDLDERSLRRLLGEGIEELSQAMLGPKVRQAQTQSPAQRWTAICLQASLADLLRCFATQAGIDLRWVLVDEPVRNRTVNLYFREVSGQRLCELAAGSAGLVARFTGETIIVHNPPACHTLNQQRDLLLREAVSAWRRLFLRAPRDKRLAEGHFAVAVLYERSGEPIDAINEYQLTARHFSKARVAPPSLLRSARIRISLRDYSGARADLNNLLDGYPECEETPDAYAVLGEATRRAGLPGEAFRIFKKLYFLDTSTYARAVACFGAGRCLYQEGHYEEAAEWLNRYVTFAASADRRNLPEAYLLLGKSHAAAGKASPAVKAFYLVLACGPRRDERLEASIELAQAYRDLGDLAKAMAVLRGIAGDARRPRRKCRILALTARIYRGMGLPEKAASFLRGNIRSVPEAAMRAELGVELARCYYDSGLLREAYDVLTESLEALSPGLRAYEGACDLAEVCLKMGKSAQALTLAGGVLNSSASGPQRQRARRLLAEACLAQRDYKKAVAALTGPAKQANGAGAEKQ